VDLVVIQNTCSEKEDSNSEIASSKSVKESSLDSAIKDDLSKENLKRTRIEHGFKRAFMPLFEDGSMAAFWVENNQFQKFIDSQFTLDYDSQMTDKYFVKYTGIEKAVEHNQKCKMTAAGQQHTEQPEIINEGKVDQYPKQCQVKSHMLDSSPDNQTTDYSKQSLESENILLKKTVAQFQKDFSRMEAHSVALELKYQNQALKSGQHGQILNETSNKVKIKKEIDVLETMNIKLEHSVAKLLKENGTLKKHHKDLYDSIKTTRSKTIEQITSLLANSADLKAQI
ncbi:hypothetical protein Tco_1026617, partial [Tanacetum coccineum]